MCQGTLFIASAHSHGLRTTSNHKMLVRCATIANSVSLSNECRNICLWSSIGISEEKYSCALVLSGWLGGINACLSTEWGTKTRKMTVHAHVVNTKQCSLAKPIFQCTLTLCSIRSSRITLSEDVNLTRGVGQSSNPSSLYILQPLSFMPINVMIDDNIRLSNVEYSIPYLLNAYYYC